MPFAFRNGLPVFHANGLPSFGCGDEQQTTNANCLFAGLDSPPIPTFVTVTIPSFSATGEGCTGGTANCGVFPGTYELEYNGESGFHTNGGCVWYMDYGGAFGETCDAPFSVDFQDVSVEIDSITGGYRMWVSVGFGAFLRHAVWSVDLASPDLWEILDTVAVPIDFVAVDYCTTSGDASVFFGAL